MRFVLLACLLAFACLLVLFTPNHLQKSKSHRIHIRFSAFERGPLSAIFDIQSTVVIFCSQTEIFACVRVFQTSCNLSFFNSGNSHDDAYQ